MANNSKFQIKTYNYNQKFKNESLNLINNYPGLYILENGQDAYIGETIDFKRRLKEHLANSSLQKYQYERIHLISGSKFNQSKTKHYEHLLIVLMKKDKKFIIRNDNNGQKYNCYYNKIQAELEFDKLWFLLEEKKLVSHTNFNDFINSSYFKYSPYNELSEEQNKAITIIKNVIDSKETLASDKNYYNRPILVKGIAGTGKTLVAMVLLASLKKDKKYQKLKIGFVIPNTTTRKEAQNAVKYIDNVKVRDIYSPSAASKNSFDILICDEAHKLRRNVNLGKYSKNFTNNNKDLGYEKDCDELDWLLRKSKNLILFYSEKQIVSPSEIPYESFKKRIIDNPKMGVRLIELKQQYRTAEKYVEYVYNVLHQKQKRKLEFKYYDFKLYEDDLKFKEKMDFLIKNNDLTRYCGGYSWKWSKNINNEDVVLNHFKLKWNSITQNWIRIKDCKYEFGSIYSLSGVDVNYLGVVIGNELYFDTNTNKIMVNKKYFFDNKLLKNTTDEDLLNNILNTYYVLLTRAIYGTYVYVCDDNLRNYLKQFINVAN